MRILLLLPIVGITTFFTLLFVYTKVAGPIPFAVNSVTTTKSDTFNVSGEGKVSIAPDIASVNVGVRSQGATVKVAQDQMNISINKVVEAIKALGVDAKDVKTANYNVNPDYDFTSGTQRIKGYTASTTIVVKVRDTSKVNSVIDTSTANGANEVMGISFEVEDRTKAENEAREKAVEDAKKKAADASRIAGFRLGRMVNYSENFGGINPPIAFRTMNAAEKLDTTATSVEPGSSEVIVNVTLSYEIQ